MARGLKWAAIMYVVMWATLAWITDNWGWFGEMDSRDRGMWVIACILFCGLAFLAGVDNPGFEEDRKKHWEDWH